jgi:hypothetical protein
MSSTEELLARSSLSNPDDIERDIGDLIQISHPALPSIHIVPNDDHPLPKGPMPDYVEHKEGVYRVGKLTAEAVVREYDAAVKEIEALGAELTEAAKRCEATVAGVHSVVNEIKELAANYRDQGKRYFLQIEECSLTTSEVRTVCEALQKKIAARTIAA